MVTVCMQGCDLMFINIKNVLVNLNTNKFEYTIEVSSDVDSLTVTCDGTSQTFTEKADNIMVVNIPIGVDDITSATIKCGDNSFGTFYNKKTVANVLNVNTKFINPPNDESVIPSVELTQITLNPIYADEEMEYSRGLNDGLILGQMI